MGLVLRRAPRSPVRGIRRNPDALAHEVDRYLVARRSAPAGDASAIIAPHAGLMYSGPIAAYAYHRSVGATSMSRCSSARRTTSASKAWRSTAAAHSTRLSGLCRSPKPSRPAFMRWRRDRVRPHPTAHGREHSLEMQLPFLQRVLPDTAIVPLVMGHQQRETVTSSATRSQRPSRAAARSSSRAPICRIIKTPASVAARLDNQVIQQAAAVRCRRSDGAARSRIPSTRAAEARRCR